MDRESRMVFRCVREIFHLISSDAIIHGSNDVIFLNFFLQMKSGVLFLREGFNWIFLLFRSFLFNGRLFNGFVTTICLVYFHVMMEFRQTFFFFFTN